MEDMIINPWWIYAIETISNLGFALKLAIGVCAIATLIVSLSCWVEGYYLQVFDSTWELEIYDVDGKADNEISLTIDDIEADDWEVIA